MTKSQGETAVLFVNLLSVKTETNETHINNCSRSYFNVFLQE